VFGAEDVGRSAIEGDAMEILGFNRVELMMSPEDMHDAVERFNDLLGTSFEPPQLVSDGNVLTTTDWDNKIELFGPAHADSPQFATLQRMGRGGIGPLVWEVDNIDEAREYVLGKGYKIKFEYEGAGVKQIVLDPKEFFGYLITFMQRMP
jgi:catechol 2,3-dioxygenase-like lactoylglutathione lyase family enzyme